MEQAQKQAPLQEAPEDAVDPAQNAPPTPSPDESTTADSEAPLWPARTLLVERNRTRVYVILTGEPWAIPAQAFVIPMGPRVGLGGLAQGYRRQLGSYGDSFLTMVQEQVRAQTKTLQPEEPVLVMMPADVQWPPFPGDPSAGPRFAVAATAYTTTASSVVGAGEAARAIVLRAAEKEISHITLPLLGSGLGELPGEQVIQAMLDGVLKALAGDPARSAHVREITLTTRDEAALTAAVSMFVRPQRVLNDASQGIDRLNIAGEAYALADVLLLRDLEPPLSVGVLGGWGSGKSFVMHLMQQRMAAVRGQTIDPHQAWPQDGQKDRQQLSPAVGHVYQINFRAWDYAKTNLWASLMHTIFFELNHQLTIEHQLAQTLAQEHGTTPEEEMLRGGPIWQVLGDIGEQDLEILLDQEKLPQLLDTLKAARSQPEACNRLWETLREAREAARGELDKTQKELAAKRAELEVARLKLQQAVDGQVTQAAREAAWQPVQAELKTLLGTAFPGFKSLVEQGAKIDLKPPPLRETLSLVRRNPMEFAAFLLFAVIAISAPWITSQLAHLKLPGGALGILSVLTGVVQLLGRWNKTLMDSLSIYRQQVDQARAGIEDQRETWVKQRLAEQEKALLASGAEALTDNVPAIERQIKTLEATAQRQRELVGLTADHVSLTEFVAARVQAAYYEKRLGLMHQIKLDLDELTAGLRGNRKLFPRGPARVVLYVDDLDRCPPKRVVEVLEATQLLLKTDLFVVVLAIDVSYIARALEKFYEKILIRRGQPSGLDYIEKIIQIPYQVRPIERDAVRGYLQAQMQVTQRDGEPDRPIVILPPGDTTPLPDPDTATEERAMRAAQLDQAVPLQVIAFSQSEYDAWLKCCQNMEMTPRGVKRLVNVSKIIKLIWARRGKQPEVAQVNAAFLLLALSERYPDLMRELLDEITVAAESKDPDILKDLFAHYEPEQSNPFLNRELASLQRVVEHTELVSDTLAADAIGLDTLNLVRSFCFVGNIGYDPSELEIAGASGADKVVTGTESVSRAQQR